MLSLERQAFPKACSLRADAEGAVRPLISWRAERGAGRVLCVNMMTDPTPDALVSKPQEFQDSNWRGQPIKITSS